MQYYYVRIGYQQAMSECDSMLESLERDDRVVLRTERGVEMGSVLCPVDANHQSNRPTILRRATPEDCLLWDQLSSLGQQASDACQRQLRATNSEDVLLEVEPLFDGRTLVFHFLGEPKPVTEDLVQQLAQTYQADVAKSRFARLLETGCGPGCGTAEKSGCKTGGCALCAVAGGCATRKS